MMMKKIFALVAAAAMLCCCAACSSSDNKEYPVRIANYTFTEKPDSIVCLNDSIADILIACGYSDRITARSDECNQPELSGLPSVGSKNEPSGKKITDADPDVVFADKDLSEEIREKLEKQNIKVLSMVTAQTNEDLKSLYENICSIADGNETGKKNGSEKSKSILMTMDDLQRLCPERDVETTACYIYDITGLSAGNDSFAGKLFTYANSINVCAANDGEMTEKIRLMNPQYIFCASGLKNKLKNDDSFKDLNAVKQDKVYEIDPSLINRQGNSITEVLSFMIECMYPELQNDNQISEESSQTSKQESSQNSKQESSQNSKQESSQNSKQESSQNSRQESSQTSKQESSQTSKQESSQTSKQESSQTSRQETEVKADNSLKITDGLEYGMGEEHSDVVKIQNRLKALGYFDDESTGYYGQMSVDAMKLFEKENGREVDGYADNDDLKLLFSANAKPNKSANSENTQQDQT